MERERLVTTAEAADHIGVTVGTLQVWTKDGKVRPALKLPGRGYRWRLSELEDQLAANQDESEQDMPNRPAVVTAIITSAQGVLIGARHDGKPPWTFIAGEREPGESPGDTITREVKEETGLEIVPGDELGERIHPATGRHMIYVAGRPASDDLGIVIGDPDELSEVRWASLAEAEQLLPGMFAPVLAHLREHMT